MAGSWGVSAIHIQGQKTRYVVNNTIYRVAGGINISGAGTLYLENNIISNITHEEGHHLFIEHLSNTVYKSRHNIFHQPNGTERIKLGSQIYSLSTIPTEEKFEGCSSADPKFIDTDNHNLHLSEESPCINNGLADFELSSNVYDMFADRFGLDIKYDIDRESRPKDNWDIGADEYVKQGDYANTDVNQDGSVDVNDIQIVVNVILGNTTNSRADVNGNGTTDIQDVQAIVNEVIS